MGVSVYYRGRLAQGKTVDALVKHLERSAGRRNLRLDHVDEYHQFHIPTSVIETPDRVLWAYNNHDRIVQYACEAGLPTKGRTHARLCQALNAARYRQVGAYLWLDKKYAEPLRFLFVEGDSRLTELQQGWINAPDTDERIGYIRFQRDSLATKTGYEHNPKLHQQTVQLLKRVSGEFFDGKLWMKGG